MSATIANTEDHSGWVAKRLHSFVGIVPLGVYVILHLSRNMSTLFGPDAFDAAVAHTWARPVNYLWLILLVYLPLLFHAGYGIYLVCTGEKKSFTKYMNLENFRFICQRLSAIGVLLFLCAHVFLTRLQTLFNWIVGDQITYGHFAAHMWTNPLTAPVYLLGILGVAYHLGNGFSTFCISWGIASGERGIKLTFKVGIAIAVLVLLMGYAAVAGFFLYDYTPAQYVVGSPLYLVEQLMHH